MRQNRFRTFKAVVILSGLFLAAGSPALAKYKKAETTEAAPAAAPVMDEAMMAKWKEYSTPNENHKILDQLVGNWEYSLKWWMSPDAPPEESIGTSQAQWILDGRYIEQVAQGQSMGQPFTGKGIFGFDNAQKQYFSTWMDNMGTGMMLANGTYDSASKILTETGIFDCPIKGKMSFRWVTTLKDQDNYVFECFTNDEKGKEFKSMEIIYKRKS